MTEGGCRRAGGHFTGLHVQWHRVLVAELQCHCNYLLPMKTAVLKLQSFMGTQFEVSDPKQGEGKSPAGNWGVSPERSRDSGHGQNTGWEEAVALFQASSFSQKNKIMASSPITSWQIDRETMQTGTDFIFLGSKITADGDCSHEITNHFSILALRPP